MVNTKKVKVAVFLAATGGGAQKVACSVAAGLVERGYSVDVVMPNARGPFLKLLPSGVKVVDINSRNPLAVLRGFKRYLRHERPDVVLSNQHHINSAAVMARKSSGVRSKVILVQHNLLQLLVQEAKNPLMKLLPRSVKMHWPKAEAIVAVSADLKDSLQELAGLPESKLHVIYNPVVTDQVLRAQKEPADHPWLVNKTAPVIIGAGNLNKQKDFGTLLRAFAIVRKSRPAKLIILGEGDNRPGLEALAKELGIADDVDLKGFVDNPFAYMANADLFALSSIYEGLGNVLIEAMACGCPVVTTDCRSGPREIVDNGKYGKLVPMRNPEALAEAILQSLSQPGDKEALRARAMEFSDKASYDAYARLIDGVLGAK